MLTLPRPENLDEIITVSPSQLDVWNNCKYKWMLTYLQNWTTGSSLSQRKGGLAHLFLKEFYDLYLDSPVLSTSMEQLVEIKDKYEGDYLLIEDVAMFYKTFKVFCGYADYATANDDFIPLATETEFWAPTGLVFGGREVYLHGIIDLLADRAGDLEVIDHKTYGGDRGRWTADMVRFDQQLAFYALALHILGYTPKTGMINGINSYDYKSEQPMDKLFAREPTTFNTKRLEIYRDNIYEIITEIHSAKVYPKRWTKDCKHCGYREVCDVILRGQDPTGLLKTKHSREETNLRLEPFTLEELELDLEENGVS
jgi:hypothetical protein